jgi:PUA domain protein
MIMNIKQRHFIQKSQIKELKQDVLTQYDEDFLNQIFPAKSRIELIQTESGDILYAINNELKLWKSKDGYIPVLTLLLNKKISLKKIVVDMGAIRFVTNGADVMRPGITKIDPKIRKGEIVEIVDETHDRSLAIGKTLYEGNEMESMKLGKVIKNLHTVNKSDDIWKFAKEFK